MVASRGTLKAFAVNEKGVERRKYAVREKSRPHRRRSQWPKKLVFAEVVATEGSPGGLLWLGDRQSSWMTTQLRYAGFSGVLVWSSASSRRVFLTAPKIQFLCSSSPIILGHMRLH